MKPTIEAYRKLKQELDAKQANLWEWRGVNPYVGHPLGLLGLEREAEVTPKKINAATQMLQNRLKQGVDDGAADPARVAAAAGMSPGRAKDLLMKPVTRVMCELLRMPPVPLPKEELEPLRRRAGELFRGVPEPPPIDDLSLDWRAALDQVARIVLRHEPALDVRAGAGVEIGPAPQFERRIGVGVSFKRRRQEV